MALLTLENLALLGFALLGSASWGYLLLRLSWPDIRVLDPVRKIGSSVLLGVIIVAIGAAAAFLFDSPQPFFPAVVGIAGVFYVGMRVGTQARSRRTIQVGIPIPKLAPGEAAAIAAAAPSEKISVELAAPERKPPRAPPPPARPAKEERVEKRPPRVEIAPPVYKPTPEAIKEAEKLRARIKEAKVELELKDIYTFLEKGGPPPEAKLGEAAAALPPRHGLWRRPAEVKERKVEEFREMTTDIYSQLRETAQPTTARGVFMPKAAPPAVTAAPPAAAPAPPARPAAAPPARPAPTAAAPGVTLEEILGVAPEARPPLEEKPTKPAEEEEEVFAKLAAIAAGKPVSPEPTAKMLELPAEPGMGCPRCHTKGVKVVFCPYCGSAMCSNCAPGAQSLDDTIQYTCPKCGEKVVVKK